MCSADLSGPNDVDPPLLVGRERERQRLRRQLAAAAAGRGRLVLVGGAAGIGKTTLVDALAREAAAQNCLVLGGACYDFTVTPPYGLWRDLVAGYRPAPGSPPLPAIFTDDEPAAGGLGDLFAQVSAFLAALAAVRPLLVVLEDLHWADPASLDLLRVAGRRLAAIPALIVGTYRVDEVTRDNPLYRVLPALVRESQADQLDLPRLDETAIQDLIAARYALPAEDAARLVLHLQTTADGNPFFAQEILRTLEAEAVLRPHGAGWELGDAARVGTPPLLRQVIDDRVARLGDETRERLAVAAVIGQEIPLDLWGAIAGLREEDLAPTVERAIAARVLEARDAGTRVGFAHALIREALYEGILPMQRRGWHRKTGEALADQTEADPEAVAHHFGQAGDARAGAWLVRAGERAQRAYAWRNAADRFASAAAALERDETRAGERGWLLYRVGRLLRYADPVQAIVYLEEAARVAAAVEDPVLAAYALSDQGMLRCFLRDIRRGLAEMAAGAGALDALMAASVPASDDIAAWVADALPEPRHARARGGDQPPPVNLRRGALVAWLAGSGYFAEAEAMGAAQLAGAGAVARPDAAVLSSLADVHLGLAQVAAAFGRPDAAAEAFARARAAHRAIDHHLSLASDALYELLIVHLPFQTTHLTDRRRLRNELNAALTRIGGAISTGDPSFPLHACYFLSFSLLEDVWPGAQFLFDSIHADSFSGLSLGIAGGLGELARRQGLPALAWRIVREELPDGPETEPGATMHRPALMLMRVAAELALDVDDRAAAQLWLTAHDRWQAWSGSVIDRTDGHLLWARRDLAGGETARARARAERALRAATEPRQPLALLRVHRVFGEIETAAGRAGEAAAHLRASLQLADACAIPYERALTLLVLAESRAAAGAPAEARVALDEVRSICVPLGAAPALARVDALASRLTAPPAAGAHPAGLSAREIEVLRLVAEGLTDAEAAARLSISPRTVGQHLRSVYNKLGVPSRAAATRFAVEHRLV